MGMYLDATMIYLQAQAALREVGNILRSGALDDGEFVQTKVVVLCKCKGI